MADMPLTEPLDITVTNRNVLIDAPGVAATLDVEGVADLADQLRAAAITALAQRETIVQVPNSGPSSSE